MKVGVYVDGFNVYVGGRYLCGAANTGWKRLDLRSLAADLIARRSNWKGANVDRVAYCTALIDGAFNPNGRIRQDTCIRALQKTSTVDHIELGHYVSRVKTAPLATKDKRGKPRVTKANWPVMVQDPSGIAIHGASFMVSVATREEKGSDVNLASHLRVDIYEGVIDAAVVLSNDSDLMYPIQEARKKVPVGTVNPTRSQLAGDLRGTANDGVGRHWWYLLTCADLKSHQLADPADGVSKPTSW